MYKDPLASQGVTLKWGTVTFTAVSVQYSASVAGEMDITSMSSRMVADTQYPNRKLVMRSVDYSVVDPGELSIEFISTTNDFSVVTSSIGMQKVLRFEKPNEAQTGLASGSAFSVTAHAFITQYGYQAQVGDFIRGSCTFKLSDS